MKNVGVILARYASKRYEGKALEDICGKPMMWWVYNSAVKAVGLDSVIIATDDERISKVCDFYKIPVIMTSKEAQTPTDRLYEVSKLIAAEQYIFIGGDEPLLNPESIAFIASLDNTKDNLVINAMTKILDAKEYADPTNIKIITDSDGNAVKVYRKDIADIPDYIMQKSRYGFKFVGLGLYTKKSLEFYHNTIIGVREKKAVCDLLRFIENGKPVKMAEINCHTISVDTPADIDKVRRAISGRMKSEE